MARKPHGAWYVYTTFQTADAPIFIGITSETQWLRICDMLEASVLRDTPALATHAGRLQERDLLHEGIATLLAAMPSAEVLRRCRAALIPCAPIAKPTDLLDDPHLNAGGGLLDIELAPGVQAKLPALPIHLNGSVPPLRTQPPRAGQNSVELLQELGFNRSEIANLLTSGVVFAEGTEDA